MRDTYRHYWDFFFQADFHGHRTQKHPVTVTQRPQMMVEELVDPDGTKKPGKTYWLPFTTKYFWAEEDKEGMECAQDLFKALAFVYELGAEAFKESSTPEELMAKVGNKLGTGTLEMYHKQSGKLVERWTCKGLWPHSVNFGELCYSSRADIEIEITWRCIEIAYEKLQ